VVTGAAVVEAAAVEVVVVPVPTVTGACRRHARPGTPQTNAPPDSPAASPPLNDFLNGAQDYVTSLVEAAEASPQAKLMLELQALAAEILHSRGSE
jgi:hypothetical protein